MQLASSRSSSRCTPAHRATAPAACRRTSWRSACQPPCRWHRRKEPSKKCTRGRKPLTLLLLFPLAHGRNRPHCCDCLLHHLFHIGSIKIEIGDPDQRLAQQLPSPSTIITVGARYRCCAVARKLSTDAATVKVNQLATIIDRDLTKLDRGTPARIAVHRHDHLARTT